MEYKLVTIDGTTLHGDKIFEQGNITSIVRFRKPSKFTCWWKKIFGKEIIEVRDVCNISTTSIEQRHILGITDLDIQRFEEEEKIAKARNKEIVDEDPQEPVQTIPNQYQDLPVSTVMYT